MTRNTVRIAMLAALASTPFACAKRADRSDTVDPSGAQALDGARFVGTVKLAGSEGGDADTLVFDGGRFESTACSKLGFATSGYTESRNGDAIEFTAVTHTEGGAQMQWKGTIDGDLAKATAAWSMPGKPARTYEFEGMRQDGGVR